VKRPVSGVFCVPQAKPSLKICLVKEMAAPLHLEN
jgi:hypothetical protein